MLESADYKRKYFLDVTIPYDSDIYEGRTESHEQQFFCKVTCFIIDKLNTPP